MDDGDNTEDTIIEEYDDIEAILAKYNINSPNRRGNQDDGEENCATISNNPSPPKKIRSEIETFNLSDVFTVGGPDFSDNDEEGELIAGLSEGNKRKNKKMTGKIENVKKDAERRKVEKEERQKERERKKEEVKRSKEIKKAIQLSNKRAKPEEAVKFITANIDHRLLNEKFGTEIKKVVENLGSLWKGVSQPVANTVTWSRRTGAHFLSDDGRLIENSNVEDTGEILLLLEYEGCVESARKGDLIARIKEIQTMFVAGPERRVTLGIYSEKNFKNRKAHTKLLELALTELQILCDCCHRFLESGEDIAAMVAQFTKSIALAPFKLEKQEKHMQAEWYMSGDNKDCVRVDKDGNGLRRLWQQQLTSFPLARIETAEAIMSVYPTFKSLMEAYDGCVDEESRERLLQDIPVRRAAGPIANVRKIGPEFSRKMALFYTSGSGASVL